MPGETEQGEEPYPRNANQNNGVDKITAVHCLWAAEIHRGLMFSGKLRVQCVNRSNISIWVSHPQLWGVPGANRLSVCSNQGH